MARAPAPHKKPPKDDTDRITGLPAVKALFEHDPRRAERLFYDDRMKPLVGGFCTLMAKQHKPYRLVPTDELSKIAGTQLHGGIVVVAKPKPLAVFDPAEARLWAKSGAPLLILDGVGNPHNLGAIARTMAFFGMERLIVSDNPAQALPSEAAFRVSEGGLEWIEVFHTPKLIPALKRLRDSHRIVGTALGAGRPLTDCLAPSAKPIAMILGNEESGLPPATLAACDEIATIMGTGRIQSLNVAATAAILIHELAKARRSA
ncbi:RNA methyltransferase [Paramagnetospirillum kuznetsovii]|uniref:RNA methyltransferase n=1 Tax=Paramagnetospirillum kuznetsovii TaxID=2053833 RepID=A0A364NZT1_9PROT|nr:RNA methyltransferase [Paramagnetospirillum kuznetsovii]RAU22584.1 RNA methyltransferase [Paramagnetospirillum kuznetsovii]